MTDYPIIEAYIEPGNEIFVSFTLQIPFFEVIEFSVEDSHLTMHFLEPVIIDNSYEFNEVLLSDRIYKNIDKITLNFKKIDEFDSFLVVIINTISKTCEKKSIKLEKIGISQKMQPFINNLSSHLETYPHGYQRKKLLRIK